MFTPCSSSPRSRVAESTLSLSAPPSAPNSAREAFLAVRGLEAWNDPGVDRDHLGTEHAAEILAWALLDEPTWAARLPDNDCEDLATGFHALTGVKSPRTCGN